MGSSFTESLNLSNLISQAGGALVLLYALSDIIIGAACIAIAILLYRLLRKIGDAFSIILLATGGFIVASAVTHLMDAWMLFDEWHSLAGWIKAVAAAASLLLAISLARNRKRILNLANTTRSAFRQRSKLEEHQMFLNAVLEGLSETIMACDADGRLTLVNRAGKELLGKGVEHISPEQWPEKYYLYESDGVTPMYWRNVPLYRALNGAILKEIEMMVKPPGKPPRVVGVVRAMPLFDRRKRKIGAVCAMIDITEKARLLEEKNLIAQNAERLKVEREVKQQFISSITHDLRNPLTAAKAAARILHRYPERVEQNDRLVSRIERNLERADRMLTDLLDATLIESGGIMPIEIRFMDLAAVARDTIEELSAIHGDRFMLDCPESVQGYWAIDGLRRVIENLASNAVKYGHERREVTVHIEQGDEETVLSVHNHGEVISPQEQQLLFTAFHRTSDAIMNGRKGWGIGLTVVKGVVEAHGGHVDVVSARESGTTFIVKLPHDARSMMPAPYMKQEKSASSPGLKRDETPDRLASKSPETRNSQ